MVTWRGGRSDHMLREQGDNDEDPDKMEVRYEQIDCLIDCVIDGLID